jgi:hypothetical protein
MTINEKIGKHIFPCERLDKQCPLEIKGDCWRLVEQSFIGDPDIKELSISFERFQEIQIEREKHKDLEKCIFEDQS